jgi:flavin reductase (DIM6/NTAB) family NADH-FMN oxidoreductase RutF
VSKIKCGNNVYIPMPVVLVGTDIKGRANFMTVGWASGANANPPMIPVGINKKTQNA